MSMIFRKNNRLAELFSVVCMDSMCHQNVRHLSDRIVIENPGIQC